MQEGKVFMDFTFDEYAAIIDSLKRSGDKITDYQCSQYAAGKRAILRHDVDLSLEKAAIFSDFERQLDVSSTYFILLTSDFYNFLCRDSLESIKRILDNGHEIGLHFDETQYNFAFDTNRNEAMCSAIQKEAMLMEEIIGSDYKVRSVSMHIPSKATLESNLEIPGIVNSYSKEFFMNWKYVSDSEMRWREDVFDIINSGKYADLHILTHPFWYSESNETKQYKVYNFLKARKVAAFNDMKIITPGIETETDLESI